MNNYAIEFTIHPVTYKVTADTESEAKKKATTLFFEDNPERPPYQISCTLTPTPQTTDTTIQERR